MKQLNGGIREKQTFWGRDLLVVGFREGYAFLSNLWGIVVHPELTLVRIFRQRRWLQAILVLGLPFYLWLGLRGVFFLVNRSLEVNLWSWPRVGWGVKGIRAGLMAVVGWELYWLGRFLEVWQKGRER